MRRKFDYFLASVVGILILLGIIILVSVSFPLSQEKFNSPTFYLFRHLLVGLIPGLFLGFLAFRVSLSFLKKWAPIFLLVNLLLMILVFVPKIGISLGGATRWINLGVVSFQPSELLKLSFLLYLAAWFAARTEKKKTITTPATTTAFFVILGIVGFLLILQPDISTLGVIVVSATLMYFSAGHPWKYFFMLVLIELGGLIALIKTASYRFERLLVFLKPEIDPMGLSYQIKQALITVGSGGILGVGLGMSIQKFFLPQPMADSIFAIFSEETGFVGSLILIILFLLFAWRGYTIAKKSQDKFYKLTAVGISSWITLQAFVNIGAMVGVLPLTGIPLPFISYGGTALVAELTGIGVLLNISKNT
jgi:cell division protein FtsW